MTYAPYKLEDDPRPRLGLIVLQADETIEDEFRLSLDPSKARLNITRIPSGADLTPDTIKAMENALPTAAALFPEGAQFDVVGYACTSGSSLIGSDRVAKLVRSACKSVHVTNPLDAAFAALKAQSACRIGIVSPYTDAIAKNLHEDFGKAGFDVAATLSFGEDTEAAVARIAPRSIMDAVLQLSENTGLDAVFLSCTNLRTHEAIGQLKANLSMPVISSNGALAWHMAKLAKIAL